METLAAKQLKIYVDNSRDIYSITESLQNSLAKKIRKGAAVSVERLASCASMRRIICIAAKMVQEYDHNRPTAADRRAVAKEHAVYIIECAKYLATDN